MIINSLRVLAHLQRHSNRCFSLKPLSFKADLAHLYQRNIVGVMSLWKCKKCGLSNYNTVDKCIACFNYNPNRFGIKDGFSNEEDVKLLITGYLRSDYLQLIDDIMHLIQRYFIDFIPLKHVYLVNSTIKVPSPEYNENRTIIYFKRNDHKGIRRPGFIGNVAMVKCMDKANDGIYGLKNKSYIIKCKALYQEMDGIFFIGVKQGNIEHYWTSQGELQTIRDQVESEIRRRSDDPDIFQATYTALYNQGDFVSIKLQFLPHESFGIVLLKKNDKDWITTKIQLNKADMVEINVGVMQGEYGINGTSLQLVSYAVKDNNCTF